MGREAAAGAYSRDSVHGRNAISSIHSMETLLLLLLFTELFLGGLIRLATEGGMFCGAGITGALVSIEVVDSSIRLRHSCWSRIWTILYMLNVIHSLLTGRLVCEKVDLAAQRVVCSQTMATFELYTRFTIGICLTETLYEMVSSGTLSPELAIQVLVQFDKSMT